MVRLLDTPPNCTYHLIVNAVQRHSFCTAKVIDPALVVAFQAHVSHFSSYSSFLHSIRSSTALEPAVE
jgi:hypothetical protein